jgi:FlaA1/EpsC-like NDP-sugar epimerase
MVTETFPPNRSKWLLSWRPRFLTRKSQFALDITVLMSAFVLSYLLRFDFVIPARDTERMLYQLPFIVLMQLSVLGLAGVNSFIWRYVGIAEIKAFINAALLSSLPLILLRAWLPEQMQPARIPFSIIVMDTAFAFGGVLALRVVRRVIYERHSKRRKVKSMASRNVTKKPVLLIGAGRAGVTLAREFRLRGDMDVEVKGFVDDDRLKLGSVVHGLKVLGTTEEVPRLVKQLGIDHVIITFAEASRQEFRRVLDICEYAKVRVRTVPGIHELLQGTVKVSRIRDIQVEDLLGRQQVQLDEEGMRHFLAHKTVMITGAGGSIGAELCRQVIRFGPSRLLLVERAEFALFSIEQELLGSKPLAEPVALVADVGDESRMRGILRHYRPQVVLHAAAHKHVPMMEYNALEAIRNNVLATRTLGELASEFAVENFVLISSDKAVCPTSIMGASKRVAELVVQDLNATSETRFVAVRFGNVIDSAGSVIPTFREQIRKGGPVTVTHPDMVRYFMTIPEAAQLVLQAGAIGDGGEIFILDMGEPVNILDLAKDTISLSGLKPFEDINIVFTGIRPGEKLYEELQTSEENMIETKHPKIFIGRLPAYPRDRIRNALELLSVLVGNDRERELRKALSDLLPEAQLSIFRDDFAVVTPTHGVAKAVSQ